MDDDDGLTGTLGGSGDAAAGVTKSEPPAPPREEMVANAVAFLRHPQVATSPEHSKRAFLEKKGLTEPEIAEAFRRVPQDKKADAADGADAKTRANDAKDPKGASKEQGLRWTQVVARAGAAVAAVSWAYKTFRPKSDFDSPGAAAPRVPPPLPSAAASDAEASASAERTAAALAQAVAAAEAAQRDAAEARARAAAAERALEAAPPPPSLTADDVSTAVEAAKRDLRRELESVVARAVRDARIKNANESESLGGPLGSLATPEGFESSAGVRRELAAIKAMLASSPLVSANANAVFRETARVGDVGDDRTPRMRAEAFGEDASGVAEVSASPEKDSEVSSFPDVVVPPSAGKSRASLASPAGDSKTQTPANGHGSSPPSTPADPPHPASYRDVLDMLDKGLTPPGIRDIDDKPPDPSRAVPRARVEPRRKPWEAASVPGASNGSERERERDFQANDAGGSHPGTKTPFENQNDASRDGEGWRPPSVPSMSSEASEVLFGRKKPTERAADESTERKQDETRTFAGFDSPGGSFAG